MNTWKEVDLTELSTIGAINSLDLIEAGNTFVYFTGRVVVDRDKEDVGVLLMSSKSRLYPSNS